MTVTEAGEQLVGGVAPFTPETPFAETTAEAASGEGPTAAQLAWTETSTPFSETGPLESGEGSELVALAEEVFESLQDEGFTEALDSLVGEVSEIVDQRMAGETGSTYGGPLEGQRVTLAEAHLAPVVVAAEQYLDQLLEGVQNLDVGELGEDRLDEVLTRHDPLPGGLTPAGEEFLGALARKARSVVSAVRKAGVLVSPLLAPVLRRLRALVQPLLRRVLALAINRLPPEFREPARLLARRLGILQAEAEDAHEVAPPVAGATTQELGEAFDAAITEFMLAAQTGVEESETFSYLDVPGEATPNSAPAWSEARDAFVDKLAQAQPGEDLTPALEQFLPALLPVLRVALRLAGRPRVVSAIAGYLAPAIKGWVGPGLAAPLSRAIVDTGLRLATLESYEPQSEAPGQPEHQLAPQVLAATVEDTVRGLAGQDESVFEDEDLLGLALSESFEQAVAANFPPELVKSELQLAPTLGGSFVVRAGRTPYAYKKFTRIPEVEVTVPIGQAIRTFGGHTLAASLRARGLALPMRARVHVYEAMPGTTLMRLARHERIPGADQPHLHAHRQLHPLTPQAAGVLLREPALGVAQPEQYLQSRRRIAIGQRFYYLEPVGQVATAAPAAVLPARTGHTWSRASGSAVRIDLRRSAVVVRLYFSEAHAQSISAAMARTRSHHPLLRALLRAYDDAAVRLQRLDAGVVVAAPAHEDEAYLGPPRARIAPAAMQPVRRVIDRWARPIIARWVRGHAPEFTRAVQDPRPGVTVILRLHAVPGLPELTRALRGQLAPAALRRLRSGEGTRGTPTGTLHVVPGRHLR
jgi:hypothetical protein